MQHPDTAPGITPPANLAERLHRSRLGPPLRTLTSRARSRSWKRSGSPPPAPPHEKQRLVADRLAESGARIFVETGTYRGDTLEFVRRRVDRAISIELEPTLYLLARHRFRSHPSVDLRQGDSAAVLPEILAEIDEPALLWLDGHFSGGVTADTGAAPILGELTAALTCDVDHTILVDDARLFDGSDGYPTLEVVTDLIVSLRPSSTIEISDDIITIRP